MMGSKDDTLPKRLLTPHIEGRPTGLDKIISLLTKTKAPEIPLVKGVFLQSIRIIYPRLGGIFKFLRKIGFLIRLRGKALNAKGSPDLEFMLREYYRIRELDTKGLPSKEALGYKM